MLAYLLNLRDCKERDTRTSMELSYRYLLAAEASEPKGERMNWDIIIGEILGLVMVTMALQLVLVPQPAAGYGTSPWLSGTCWDGSRFLGQKKRRPSAVHGYITESVVFFADRPCFGRDTEFHLDKGKLRVEIIEGRSWLVKPKTDGARF